MLWALTGPLCEFASIVRESGSVVSVFGDYRRWPSFWDTGRGALPHSAVGERYLTENFI